VSSFIRQVSPQLPKFQIFKFNSKCFINVRFSQPRSDRVCCVWPPLPPQAVLPDKEAAVRRGCFLCNVGEQRATQRYVWQTFVAWLSPFAVCSHHLVTKGHPKEATCHRTHQEVLNALLHQQDREMVAHDQWHQACSCPGSHPSGGAPSVRFPLAPFQFFIVWAL